MARYLMGIDVGTYESKGVIIDTEGRVICSLSTPHGMENPLPHHYEHDAEEVWLSDVLKLSNGLLDSSGIPAAEILGLGLSTLGTCLVPVDKELRPLRKAILYGIDARATDEWREMTELYGEDGVLELFGRPICSDDVAAKILWIKNKEPEVYAKTYKFLTGTSFLVARLTGNFYLDRFLGSASFKPLYRPDGSIREEMCGPYCRPDQLPRGQVVTDCAGYITEEAARLTGLLPGTPVMTGSGDSSSESISTGVLDPGDAMIQLGSSMFMYCCTDRLINDPRIHGGGFLIPDRYSVSAGTNNCGTVTRWFRDNIYFDLKSAEDEGGGNAYAAMMKGIDDIPIGSGGLVTLPYLAGERSPINDPDARGLVIGLTLKHTRAHLYRSALEGVCFTVAQHVDILKENGISPLRLHAVGGGTKNPYWMQMCADICGEPLNLMEVTIGASYGDALMAGICTGVFSGFSELRRVLKPAKTVYPDMEKHELYKPFRKVFDEAYAANRDLMHRLG